MSHINLKEIETKIGTMVAAAVSEGLCLLEFSDRKTLSATLKSLESSLKMPIKMGENAHLAALENQLAAYFEGKRTDFDLPLFFVGTDFQQSVWRMLQTIPYGYTKSYQQQANDLGKPKSVRAVANANGQNKISIIVPCHRVIGADGKLTGYGGGLWRKQFLLELEGARSGQTGLFGTLESGV
jgi:AraC family transcriptional regulator, regulatory protein of adaptative response / methylated-DNA-[protein]-cysteine methyltransferase